MAEEKQPSRAAALSEGKILDQEALDQMLEDSAGDDVKQLESMLNELEEPSDAQTDHETTASDETDMDALADNMEALLDRLESGDTTEVPSDTSASRDKLYQATRADIETSTSSELSQKNIEDSAEIIEETDLNALLENAEKPSEEETELGALLADAEKPSEEETELGALLADAEKPSEEETDLDALLADAEKPSEEETDLGALLADAEEATEEDTDLDALLADAEKSSEEDTDLDALLADAEKPSEEDTDLDALLADAEEATEEDTDLDALLADAEKPSEEDTDLDALLSNTDSINELNIGIEDEVAQILTTGGDATGILKDFQSAQANLHSLSETDGDSGILLVIDGDDENRALFQDALSSGNYHFIEATNGRQALQVLRQESIDLVLINLDQNEEESIELIETIASNPELPNLPIIVNSEHNDRIEKALRIGAVDYLTRPLDVMDIEFQIPHKVANQIKLRKAERILAGVESAELTAVPDIDEDGEEIDLDDLLEDKNDDFISAIDRSIDHESHPESLLVAAPGGMKAKKNKDRIVPLSDQQKMLRERKQIHRPSSRLPLVMGIVALLIGLGAVSYYAMDYFKDYLQGSQQTTIDLPVPVPMPGIKPPEVPQQDYAMSQPQSPMNAQPTTPADNTYRQQAEILKTRIRQNVHTLSESGGAWWSPWRVMRESGATVDGLVNRRSVDDILNAFGVDQNAVETGLQNERTLDFLASVGFDLRGKRTADLTARETFELLSARHIRSAEQLVEILSSLTDKLADDRTAQAEHKEREQRKRKGQAFGQTTWHRNVQPSFFLSRGRQSDSGIITALSSSDETAQIQPVNKPPPSGHT